jgi:hypothetical protein
MLQLAHNLCAVVLAMSLVVGSWTTRSTAQVVPRESVEVRLTQQKIDSFISVIQPLRDISKAYFMTESANSDGSYGASAVAAVQQRNLVVLQKAGFATWEDYGDVTMTIAKYRVGIDPVTGKFTDKSAAVRTSTEAAIASVPTNQFPGGEAERAAALKAARNSPFYAPAKYPENSALIEQNYIKLRKAAEYTSD